MRVLVIRVTSMGDVVLTLPAVSDMVANIPGVKIDWVVEKPFAPIAAMHPGVAKVIPVQWRKWRKSFHQAQTRAAWRDFRTQVRAHPYDMVLDFQGQIAKSIILGKQARGPIMGFGWNGLREPLSSLFYSRRANVSRSLHLVPRSRNLAAQLCNWYVA
jgi:heptosyltransferase I